MLSETQIQTIAEQLPQRVVQQKNKKGPLVILAVCLFVFICVAASFFVYRYSKGSNLTETVNSTYNLGTRVPQDMEVYNFPGDFSKLVGDEKKQLACGASSGEIIQCIVETKGVADFPEHKLTAVSYRRLPYADEERCKNYLSDDGQGTPLIDSIQVSGETVYHGASQWRNKDYLVRDLAHRSYTRGLCVEILARSLFDPSTNLTEEGKLEKYRSLFKKLGSVQFNLNVYQ